jgi:undecaprenyl-diphosphatase
VSLLEAIVLGIVQGLTEFLPVSSTAHLRIVPAFAGWEDPGAAFTAVTQLGTMAAVLLYFRDDLRRIALAWLRSLRAPELRTEQDARLGWYILLGTVPIGIFGLVFKDQIETGARDLYLIGSMLILLGLLLALAEKVGTRTRGIEQIKRRDGIAIGLAQALALIPGVSRSGATITAGLFLGLERPAAARFSFLLSVPAVVLSGVLELGSILSGEEGETTSLFGLLVATVLAFVTGYLSIAFLLRYLAHHSTVIFVVYRVVLGAIVLVCVSAGVIE